MEKVINVFALCEPFLAGLGVTDLKTIADPC